MLPNPTPPKVICWHSGGCWEANVRKSHVWASLKSQELSLVLRGGQLYECFPEQTWSPLHFVSFLQLILSMQPASGCQYIIKSIQAPSSQSAQHRDFSPEWKMHSHPFLFRPQCYTQAVYGVSAHRHTLIDLQRQGGGVMNHTYISRTLWISPQVSLTVTVWCQKVDVNWNICRNSFFAPWVSSASSMWLWMFPVVFPLSLYITSCVVLNVRPSRGFVLFFTFVTFPVIV